MSSVERELRTTLRRAGLTAAAIDAVWPEWWSTEAGESASASAELRFTLARRLGLAPSSLIDGPPRFVWRDETRFKNLGTASEGEAAVLASFAVGVGRCAIRAATRTASTPSVITARDLRTALVVGQGIVDLDALLATCWTFGIPVIHLAIFPLAQKRMHSVATRLGERYAILIGRESKFPAQVAYFVAHEIGHVLLGHIRDSVAMLDVEDPLKAEKPDHEELAADRFALELLTGSAEPDITVDRDQFTARQLAGAAMEAAEDHSIDPGVIALCLAHRTGQWQAAMGALKIIPPGEVDVPRRVNRLAASELDWGAVSIEDQAFLSRVMGDPLRDA